MPTPKKGESKDSFIGRCVPIVKKEGKDQKEALGKCFGIWQNFKNRK